jgi:UDP-GlcNAc:undecaprenyl-phosphate GlcNAc-1-phosphate transferase
MSGMTALLSMTGKAFLIALFLTPIIRDISRSFNVVDRPGVRKVHIYPIPRVGGIAIAIAYGVALFSAGTATDGAIAILPAWKILPGAAIVFLTGLLDDFFSLRPVVKLFGLGVAATVVFANGLRVGDLATHPLPVWADFPLTLFWLLLTSNALNLIDGLDGLCAGMGFVSTLTLFCAAILHGNQGLAFMTLPLAGALVGFLCYNSNPATVFLGDSGALLIGFLLGCYGMTWTLKTSTLLSMIVPLLALAIPLLDVSLSVVRRFLRNQPIFTADRGHIHHRLLDRGLSARQAVLTLYLFGGLAAAFALLASSPIGGKYQVVIILMFCGVAFLGIRQLRYSEFEFAGRFFGGELTKTMSAKMRLEAVSKSLTGSGDVDAWWATLVGEAETLGLSSIRWTGPRGMKERIFARKPAAWRLEVTVSATDSVEISGQFLAPSRQLDLMVLAETMEQTFPGKAREPRGEAEHAAAAVL